jgi:cephalosporin hydroxylase
MNDPVAQFQAEKAAEIEAQHADPAFRAKSLDWIVHSSKYRYSYHFTWMGRPVIQYPQDILAMQEIIWAVRPTVIIETGIAHGGSLVFYASMLELLGGDGVAIGIDVDIRAHNRAAIEAHAMSRRIRMIEGSSTAPEVVARVAELVYGRGPVLVALDSLHTHDHTLAELRLYSRFVTPGSYLVVFDTIIEDMPAGSFPDRPWDKGANPKTAVREFIKENGAFIVDRGIQDKLMITTAPEGYLKRIEE